MAKLASARWTRIEKDHFIKEEIYEMAWTKDGRRKDLSKYTIAFGQYGGPIAMTPKSSKRAEVSVHSLSGVDIGRLDGTDSPLNLSEFRPHPYLMLHRGVCARNVAYQHAPPGVVAVIVARPSGEHRLDVRGTDRARPRRRHCATVENAWRIGGLPA